MCHYRSCRERDTISRAKAPIKRPFKVVGYVLFFVLSQGRSVSRLVYTNTVN